MDGAGRAGAVRGGGAARSSRRSRSGSPWGRPWGTVWFHLTGEVPAAWTDPGTRPELVVDLGFSDAQPGFQAEGLAYRPTARCWPRWSHATPHVPLPGAPARPSTSTSRRPRTRTSRGAGPTPHPARRPRDGGLGAALPAAPRSTSRCSTCPCGSSRRTSGRCPVWSRSCRPTCRGAPRCCAPSNARSTPWTPTTSPAPPELGRAELAGVLASPAYAERAPRARRRARAHRLGVAVAGARDRPQGGPHVRQRRWR